MALRLVGRLEPFKPAVLALSAKPPSRRTTPNASEAATQTDETWDHSFEIEGLLSLRLPPPRSWKPLARFQIIGKTGIKKLIQATSFEIQESSRGNLFAPDHAPVRSLAWFGLALALVIAAAYRRCFSGARLSFTGITGIFGFPLAHYVRTSYWHGEWPLWNPFNNCGLPFLAQWNTLALYPAFAPFMFSSPPLSLAFFCLFHLWLSGLGMACLVSRWTGSPAAARLAGAGYAFMGFCSTVSCGPNNIAAFAWLPFTVLYRPARLARRGASLPLAVFVAAAQMLSGAPEIILFTWGILSALFLSKFVREPGEWKAARALPLDGRARRSRSKHQLLPFRFARAFPTKRQLQGGENPQVNRMISGATGEHLRCGDEDGRGQRGAPFAPGALDGKNGEGKPAKAAILFGHMRLWSKNPLKA